MKEGVIPLDIRKPANQHARRDRKAPAFLLFLFLAGLLNIGAVFRPTRMVNGELQLVDGPLDSCRFHFVHRDTPLVEKTLPCGKAVAVPAGAYLFWLEMDDLVTPWPGFGHSSGEPGTLVVATPVDHAGFVTVADSGLPPDEDLFFRLYSVRHQGEVEGDRRTFRRVVHPGARGAVRMPAGSVVGGLFRPDGEAVALARPIDLAWKATAQVVPRRPSGASDVFAELTTQRLIDAADLKSLSIQLTTEGEDPRKPDVLIARVDGVRAFWYEVPWRRAKVESSMTSLYLPSQEIRLTPGNVTTVRTEYRKKPALNVRLDAPFDAFDRELAALNVLNEAGSVVGKRLIDPGSEERFEALPAERLLVRIKAGRWQLTRRVDLTSGEDASVLFDVDPLVVSGRIEKGDEPLAGARMEWLVDRDAPLRVQADETGSYRVTLWRAGLVPVLIRESTADDESTPPFMETLDVRETMERDFQLPDTRVSVLVLDAETGKPVPGATLAIGNKWDAPKNELSTTGLKAVTDADGKAKSPPLREGTMTIFARADGYQDGEPVERATPAEGEVVEIVIRLVPDGDTTRVAVLLPDRRPAGRAEAWVVAPDGRPVWQAMAGADGALSVPQRLAGSTLIVRHADAASEALAVSRAPEELVLRPAAPPLRVRVVDAAGDPVPWALIGIVTRGGRLLGGELSFLTWSRGASNGSGIWEAKGLPAEPVRVFAWKGEAHPTASAGGFDALATVIPWPWPDDVVLVVLE